MSCCLRVSASIFQNIQFLSKSVDCVHTAVLALPFALGLLALELRPDRSFGDGSSLAVR